jgi:hypothetical protein
LHHTFGFECGVSETLAIHHYGDLFYVAADVIVPGDDNPKVRACRVKERLKVFQRNSPLLDSEEKTALARRS